MSGNGDKPVYGEWKKHRGYYSRPRLDNQPYSDDVVRHNGYTSRPRTPASQQQQGFSQQQQGFSQQQQGYTPPKKKTQQQQSQGQKAQVKKTTQQQKANPQQKSKPQQGQQQPYQNPQSPYQQYRNSFVSYGEPLKHKGYYSRQRMKDEKVIYIVPMTLIDGREISAFVFNVKGKDAARKFAYQMSWILVDRKYYDSSGGEYHHIEKGKVQQGKNEDIEVWKPEVLKRNVRGNNCVGIVAFGLSDRISGLTYKITTMGPKSAFLCTGFGQHDERFGKSVVYVVPQDLIKSSMMQYFQVYAR